MITVTVGLCRVARAIRTWAGAARKKSSPRDCRTCLRIGRFLNASNTRSPEMAGWAALGSCDAGWGRGLLYTAPRTSQASSFLGNSRHFCCLTSVHAGFHPSPSCLHEHYASSPLLLLDAYDTNDGNNISMSGNSQADLQRQPQWQWSDAYRQHFYWSPLESCWVLRDGTRVLPDGTRVRQPAAAAG